ncbi:hypothetical protein PGT21_030248 [Puccinia graminis f. sp. tritici]|nr:hypothetical protein PGT21_030248 [Puccinia graminis f. sp. tritici]
MWITRRLPYGFLGISVAYITDDWIFKTCHLSLKYIPSILKGKYMAIPIANILRKTGLSQKIVAQTTDSGSNTGPMPEEVATNVDITSSINLSDDRIPCFSHKLTLILNAGLNAIPVEQQDEIPFKEDILGSVPDLEPDYDEDDMIGDDVLLYHYDDKAKSEDDCSNTQKSRALGANKINFILKKVDFVMQKTTASLSRRSEFDTWAKNLEYVGPRLIPNFVLDWSYQFQNRDRAFKARNVIDTLIKNERDRQQRDGGKDYYSNVEISEADWEIVKNFNDIIGVSTGPVQSLPSVPVATLMPWKFPTQEFYFLMKKMEGDISSGSMILDEYRCLRDYLQSKARSANEPELKEMTDEMLSKLETCVTETLKCDAILIATALNPCFRLALIKMCYPSDYARAKGLLEEKFAERKREVEAKQPPKEPSPKPELPIESSHNQRFLENMDLFPDSVQSTPEDELSIYLRGKYKMVTSKSTQSLPWWKEHADEFPILSLLARDYLACCASSSGIERCLSAAGNLCGREYLAAKSVEDCVSSHLWLSRAVTPDGPFAAAQQIIQSSADDDHEEVHQDT